MLLNFAAYKYKHVCVPLWVRNLEAAWLDDCTSGSQQVDVQESPRASCLWRINGLKYWLPGRTHSHGCWQKASVPRPVGLSCGLPGCPQSMAWQLVSSTQESGRQKPQCPFDLTLEVMHSHLYRFLKSSQEDMFIDFGEREKHCCVASIMCPDWGSNPQPFGVWDYAATNWATQQGHLCHVLVTSQTNQDTLREGIWYHMDISRQDHWGPSCMLVTTASFYM